MEDTALTFIALGAILVLALAAEWVSSHTPLPRVSALLLIGVVVGPTGLDLLPQAQEQWEPIATDVALTMVGFLLGREFERHRVHEHGRRVFVIAVLAALITSAVTAGGLLLVGVGAPLALALGGIAAATAPAATLVVIRDQRAEGPLTATLLALVAIDDAVAIALFTVLLALGAVIAGGGGVSGLVFDASREILGGIALGAALGIPAAFVAGRVRREDPLLVEAFALVLLLAGLGAWLNVSFLLAAVVAGALVVNLTRERRAFTEVEHVEWPFLAVFFVLGGAALQLPSLRDHAVIIAAYVVARCAGKIAGAWFAARAVGSEVSTRRWLGPALLPQAGVGLGLALLARERFPELAETVIPVTVVATVIFELFGPVMTRVALHQTGEAGGAGDDEELAGDRG